MKLYNLFEEIYGIDIFVNKMLEKFFMDNIKGDYKKFKSLIISSIDKSGCQKIEFGDIKSSRTAGLSLHDRVIINKLFLNFNMGFLLYVIFHEIAHQYQYKKYGIQKIYGMYYRAIENAEISNNKSFNSKKVIIDKQDIDFLRQLETTADEYGIRKTREFIKYGFISQKDIPKKTGYKEYSDQDYEYVLKTFINIVNSSGNKDYSPQKISELLFNQITNKII